MECSVLQIGACRATSKDNGTSYCARIDGEDVNIEFHGNCQVTAIGSLYLAVSLLQAMATGRPIHIDESLPVNARLMANLARIQGIFSSWNHGLKPVPVEAAAVVETAVQPGGISFFSGGVDSNYTLHREMDSITHLVALNSFEGTFARSDWEAFTQTQGRIAQQAGKQLVCVTGDYGPFCRKRGIVRYFQHGLDLCGVASALGFGVSYIPTSMTFDWIFPWGSHPVSDPLWGGNDQKIVHHGLERRLEKLASIAQQQYLLDNLQVCWQSAHDNCGQCVKCLRTMVGLKLLGLRSQSLPELADYALAGEMWIGNEAAVPFFRDIAMEAAERGELELEKMMRRKLWRYTVRHHGGILLDLLAPRPMKKTVRRLVHGKQNQAWITMSEVNPGFKRGHAAQ
ncbi:hypothetical protein [Parahaliea mediterranea]|uniref:Uncharacterized protein n=1 Tax=Parahaliea mediterranea TaxID=651086 RepID=A0A939DG04_9GAMM|nr:hypothetical protein [Parahaliea mediterranea]MBN7796852.1 hypothetical protein [Parahaliea mediterranea]